LIKVVSFYKDISLDYEKAKKLKQRMLFNYKDSQKKLFATFQKFSNKNCEFIVSTDNYTILDNYPKIERNNLDEKLLMESVAIANNNFIQKEIGKIIFLGVDHLFCGNPEKIFTNNFDIALLVVDVFDETHCTNINNTLVAVNANENNILKIRKFFKDRLDICLSLPLKERRWYADQKSLSLLLEREGIITQYHKTKNTFYIYDNLKIKLIPWGDKYLKIVNSAGEYKKDVDDVIIDFCGGDNVKQHFESIFQTIMVKK